MTASPQSPALVAGGKLCLLSLVLAIAPSVNGAELKEARVTQVVKDVKLLPNTAAARPAVVSDEVRDGTAVRTGVESRAELTFTDSTLARLGANTIFSFTEGTRNLDLKDGVMLLRVPKDAGGAKINTAAVTAAITGTTVMLEYHPHSYIKFIILEGTGRIFLPHRLGESVLVHAGQMLITKPEAKNLPRPVDVDVKKIMKTSRLIKGFAKLESEPLIALVEAVQDAEKANGQVYETNLAIVGAGTDVALLDPTHAELLEPTPTPPPTTPTPTPTATPTPPPTPTPTPTPSKVGRPQTISSPSPYLIKSTTQITTDPSITTDGVTNYGTIYRSTALDGTRSIWFFDATRPFDTLSGFDGSDQTGINADNIAVFKFQNLQLAGNPTISTLQGGVTKLALVGVDGITSGPPGGTLTFAGLDTVLLATRGGSIVLGSEISFQNIQNLVFYARGVNAALTLGSLISGVSNLQLNSEGSMQVNGDISTENFKTFSNGDFLQGGSTIAANVMRIDSVNGNITVDAGKLPDPALGGTIELDAGATLNILNPSGAGPTKRSSIVANGNTINFISSSLFTFDFRNSNLILFGAGSGGLHAANINFLGPNFNALSGSDINIFGAELPIVNGDQPLSGQIDASGSILAVSNLESATLIAGSNVTAGGNVYAAIVLAGGNITIGGDLNVLSSVSADGIVTAGTISSTNVVGSVINAGQGGIRQFSFANGTVPAVVHTLIADTVISVGGVFFDGTASNGIDQPGSDAGALTISANSLDIGLAGDIRGSFTLNGGDGGFGSNQSFLDAGGGGTLVINTNGDLAINSDIEATSGRVPDSAPPSGHGGDVTLNSTNGAVSVSSRIEVSSAQPLASAAPRRLSKSGGNLALRSDKPSGLAINVSNTAPLLALLDAAAPGPGGKVAMLATGASSVANVNGRLVADRGTIDIRHTGVGGQVNVGGPNLGDTVDARADVIKIAALGNNGVLTIDNGTLSADTTLQLYSQVGNGTVNFVGNVTLGGAGTKTIAGDTVNIFNGVFVTIGGQNPANVFTNHPNYTGFGGNGSRTGTFGPVGGPGANNPQPLNQAPPLGP